MYTKRNSSITNFYAVNSITGCWEWTGAKIHTGYGRYRVNGVLEMAHRVMFERFKGPIPHRMQVDHVCRNKGCVNPEHLRLLTGAQNVQQSRRTTLTEFMVAKIREKAPFLTKHQLAIEFNQSWDTINNILKGKTWIGIV